MEDIIRVVMDYVRKRYKADCVTLTIGYNMKYEPKIRFILPSLGILVEFSAAEIMSLYEQTDSEYILQMIDNGIKKMAEDYMRRFGDGNWGDII